MGKEQTKYKKAFDQVKAIYSEKEHKLEALKEEWHFYPQVVSFIEHLENTYVINKNLFK